MIQIGLDGGGWPINAMTLREILKALGFKDDGKKITLEKNDETNILLGSYPLLLVDDGMNNGVFPEYVTDVDASIHIEKVKAIDYVVGTDPKLDVDRIVKEENISVFNVFRDRAYVEDDEG